MAYAALRRIERRGEAAPLSTPELYSVFEPCLTNLPN